MAKKEKKQNSRIDKKINALKSVIKKLEAKK